MSARDSDDEAPVPRECRFLPLHLLERTNEAQMRQLFELFRFRPSVIAW